jgi:organic radical activating enzyme
MLEGKRPEECNYCWNVEDNSNEFSDRVYKSNEPWSKPYLNEIQEMGWRKDFNPKYVEIAFSNACNFKCSYCGPSFSSAWVQEAKKYGPMPTTDRFNDLEYLERVNKLPIHHNEYNPYVEAFWKWWPDLYRDLHTFRITGGEPLMANDTWDILNYIIDNPNPNRELKLGINSNLGVPDKLIDKLIEKIQIIEEQNLVKDLLIYTSCDTAGVQAEYIRTGLDYNKWKSNVNKVLSSTKKCSIIVMSTYNALSIPNYKELITDIYDIKVKYNSKERYNQPSVMLDSSYLRHPTHQTVQILPQEFHQLILDSVKLMETLRVVNKDPNEKWEWWHTGYTDIEIDKVKRIVDWMKAPQDEQHLKLTRLNFYTYINAHDKRRETNFLKTFPTLENFYNLCKDLYDAKYN